MRPDQAACALTRRAERLLQASAHHQGVRFMGLLKQLLKPFSRKTTRALPISRQAQRVRLMVETLEDRLAPAITTSFDAAAHALTVNLSAVGDHAYLRVNAGNIAV